MKDNTLNKNFKKCERKLCKCRDGNDNVGCVKIINNDLICNNKKDFRSCSGDGCIWHKQLNKCVKCIKEQPADKSKGINCYQKQNFNMCNYCTKDGYYLYGNTCKKHTNCQPPLITVKQPTNISDRVCGTGGSGTCPFGWWESSRGTSNKSNECSHPGYCLNGKLIDPINQTRTNHCESCDPGYRLCKDNNECKLAENFLFVVPPPKNTNRYKKWNPGTDCIPNKCHCSNGTSITPDTSPQPADKNYPNVFFKPSKKCLVNNDEYCVKCDKGYYLKDKKCLKLTVCNDNQYVSKIPEKNKEGTNITNRVCGNCPINTKNKQGDGKTLGSMKDCKCTSGNEIFVKDNQNKTIDIKCSCLNGKLVTVSGNEKDCVCDAGYYGGGKKKKVDLKDITKYEPYGPCMKKIDCKCSNGNIATNVSCKQRNIQTITTERVTNTGTYGECPIINTFGRRWTPSMGSLSDPKNAGFKKSSRKCPKEGQLLCESCMNGFVFNKRKIRKKDGTEIPINTTCVLATDDNAKPQPTQQPKQKIVTTDTMKQTVPGKKIKRIPYKTTRLNDGSATSNVYNMMIQSNRR